MLRRRAEQGKDDSHFGLGKLILGSMPSKPIELPPDAAKEFRPIAKSWVLWRICHKRFLGIMMFAATALNCTSGAAAGLSASWPTNEYRNLSCAELAQEGRTISKRGFTLSGLKPGLGGSDGTATAPALVFVWPEPTASEKPLPTDLVLASKQMDAIESASVERQCSIRFQRPLAK